MTYEEAIELLKRNKPTSDPRKCGQELCLACDIAMESIEKQIPKKPKEMLFSDTGICQCGTFVTENETYCCVCGQAIDWSE